MLFTFIWYFGKGNILYNMYIVLLIKWAQLIIYKQNYKSSNSSEAQP